MADSKYVLVVDDDEDVRKLLRDVLKTLNIETGEAADGREAIKAIEERRPDLIILDLMMPVMDGFSFITRTRGKTGPLHNASNIPIILLSAIADTQSHMKNLPGVVGTIRKGNISLLEVTGLITSTLGVDNGFVRQSEEVAKKNAEADAKAAADSKAAAEAKAAAKEEAPTKAQAPKETAAAAADAKAADAPMTTEAKTTEEAKKPADAAPVAVEARRTSTDDKDTPPLELPAAEKAVAGTADSEKDSDSADTSSGQS